MIKVILKSKKPEIQKVIGNAVKWSASISGLKTIYDSTQSLKEIKTDDDIVRIGLFLLIKSLLCK